jgi:protein-disulfide isomerase
MSTRAEQRAARRAEREARERAAASAAARRRRLSLLGGALVAAAIVVAIAIAVSSGGSSKNSAGGRAGAQAVAAELRGVPQAGTTIGNPKAPVTITEYADLQCPICRDFNLNTFPELLSKEIRTGHVKMVYRNLETATSDSQVFRTQQTAALAAGKQSKLWNYVELFYRNQGSEDSGYVTGSFLSALARSIPGLDFSTWARDRGDSSLGAQVTADASAARKLGFNSTPSFVVQGPTFPSRALVGLAGYSDLQKAIQQVGG